MAKKILMVVGCLALLAIPVAVLAQDATAPAAQSLSLFHKIYEKSVGPLGAVAGFIGIIAMWQMAARVSPAFGFMLRMFAVVVLLLNIGSISFGMHGVGIVGKEMTRYIERITRFSALVLFDISALALYLKLEKKESPKPEKTPNPTQNAF